MSYLATLAYMYKTLVEIDVNMNLEVRCYCQEIKKHKYVCLITKVCKQLICKSSGLKISIELSFYKKNFFNLTLDNVFMICYAFCQCHDKAANLLTFALLELK